MVADAVMDVGDADADVVVELAVVVTLMVVVATMVGDALVDDVASMGAVADRVVIETGLARAEFSLTNGCLTFFSSQGSNSPVVAIGHHWLTRRALLGDDDAPSPRVSVRSRSTSKLELAVADVDGEGRSNGLLLSVKASLRGRVLRLTLSGTYAGTAEAPPVDIESPSVVLKPTYRIALAVRAGRTIMQTAEDKGRIGVTDRFLVGCNRDRVGLGMSIDSSRYLLEKPGGSGVNRISPLLRVAMVPGVRWSSTSKFVVGPYHRFQYSLNAP